MELTFTIETLLEKCKAGNRKSEKDLYDYLAPKMYPVCLKYFKNIPDAEDALQEGFIRLFKNLHTYRYEGSFVGWARRIFKNASISMIRNKKAATVGTEPFENAFVCRQPLPIDALYEKDIINCTSQLPDGYKKVFTLYAIKGFAHLEISRFLGISPSTSKTQYLRAKSKMRAVLNLHSV